MKNAHLRFGWLTYVKSTEKTTTSIKLRLGPLYRGSVARSASAGQGASYFRDRRGHTGCGGQRGDLPGRQVHGGGTRSTADSNMSRTKRTVLQRLGAACRAQEAPPSPCRAVGRVRFQQRVGEFGAHPAGKLGKQIHLGGSRPYLRNPRNAGLGGLVCPRTGNASGDHPRSRYRMCSGAGQRRERTVSRLAQLGRGEWRY